MKLYILADRLKRSVEEVLKAAKKLELDIKSSEQKLTHDQVIELTKYFTEKRRFLFFILLWNYLLGFLTAFIALFKRRGYLYGLISGLTIFTIFAFDNVNTNSTNENDINVIENEIVVEDDEILATDSNDIQESNSEDTKEVDNSEPVENISATDSSTTTTPSSTTTTPSSTTTTPSSTTTTPSSTTTTTTTSTTTIYVDDEPPTWPDKTLNIQNINETYFEVLWISAIDNVNVAGYRFYLDGVLKGEYIRNNDNNSIFLDTLSSGTSYTLEVEAYDDNGNVSIDNPIIVVSTASPLQLQLQLHYNNNNNYNYNYYNYHDYNNHYAPSN